MDGGGRGWMDRAVASAFLVVRPGGRLPQLWVENEQTW